MNMQEQSHKVFESTVRSAQAMVAKGVNPGAIIAGLLGVISQIGSETVGPEELARALRITADELCENFLDS